MQMHNVSFRVSRIRLNTKFGMKVLCNVLEDIKTPFNYPALISGRKH